MLRQPFVDERVIGVQQFERAAVVAQDVAEQHFRLAPEAFADVVVEVREHQQVGRDLRLQVAELQPLAGEVADESVRAPSASIRFYLAASTPGWRRRPDAARFSSRSSGMLLHMKNDRRDARSTSLTGCAAPGRTPAGSLSIRYRNDGLDRSRARPARMPASNVSPFSRDCR